MKYEIFETPWIYSVNQLCEVKHFWAVKGGRVGVVTALKTHGIGFYNVENHLGNNISVYEFVPVVDDSVPQKAKLQRWLESK